MTGLYRAAALAKAGGHPAIQPCELFHGGGARRSRSGRSCPREPKSFFRSKFGSLLVLFGAFSASLGTCWSYEPSNRTNILPNLLRNRIFIFALRLRRGFAFEWRARTFSRGLRLRFRVRLRFCPRVSTELRKGRRCPGSSSLVRPWPGLHGYVRTCGLSFPQVRPCLAKRAVPPCIASPEAARSQEKNDGPLLSCAKSGGSRGRGSVRWR